MIRAYRFIEELNVQHALGTGIEPADILRTLEEFDFIDRLYLCIWAIAQKGERRCSWKDIKEQFLYVFCPQKFLKMVNDIHNPPELDDL